MRVQLEYSGANSPRGKVWIGAIQSDGALRIQYGAKGSNLRSTIVPASRFSAGHNAYMELNRRMQEKLDKGYQVVEHNDPDTRVEDVNASVGMAQSCNAKKSLLGKWFF